MQVRGPNPTKGITRSRLLRSVRGPEDLEALRRVVVGPEQRRLDRIENPSPEVVGNVLPEAMAHAAKTRPDELATALVNPVSGAIRDVARREPTFFGEILAPAIGTAVRRAVTDAIAALMQRINQLLDRGMSLRSLRWRFEARRTGRPYAEIVAAHMFIYRVEWVILIHTETSLVLEQVSAPDAEALAPDQTSAMLQAINSFVSDALQPTSPGAALHAIEVGDLSLWIERGAALTLAVAIRGVAPVALREALRRTLDRIHTLHHEHARQPDVASFADTHPLLADCLQQQARATPRRAQWVFATIGAAALLVTVALLGRASAHHRIDAGLRAAYRTVLQAPPGIVVTSIERAADRYVIRGLRDPRSVPPSVLIAGAGLPAAELELAPYESRDARFAPAPDAMDLADAAIRSLEQVEIGFEPAATQIDPSQPALAVASELIRRADRAASRAHAALCVEVLGDNDETGNERLNSSIRAARAASVVRALELHGVDGRVIAARGGDPLRARPHARRVTFRAALRPDRRQRGCPP